MNTDEIRQRCLDLHNTLGSLKAAKDKALFNQQHAQLWADCDTELKQRKGELESAPALTPEELNELALLARMFPRPQPPSRDLAAEIDEIKTRLESLAQKIV